jgi:hypothetical protein
MTKEERNRRGLQAALELHDNNEVAARAELRRGTRPELNCLLLDKYGFTVHDLSELSADWAPEFSPRQEAILRPILSSPGTGDTE